MRSVSSETVPNSSVPDAEAASDSGNGGRSRRSLFMESCFGRRWKKKFFTVALLLLLAGSGTCLWMAVGPGLESRIPMEELGIARLHSELDADQDGVDDQTDLYQNALTYLQSRPRYKSRYYASGYPDDHCGVCTDVIAFAMRDAGYDLQKLMNEDILLHPEAYSIETPDANIDFRRVPNIRTWLDRHARSLSLDLSDLPAWQPGDIVVFPQHIAMISENRNASGVPFVLHHRGGLQLSGEEDILESRQDIVGHYRLDGSRIRQ